jgi:hypothetical protein
MISLADWQAWLGDQLNQIRANGILFTYQEKEFKALTGCEIGEINLGLSRNQDKGFQGIISTKLKWESE